jgi:predicted secreted protein
VSVIGAREGLRAKLARIVAAHPTATVVVQPVGSTVPLLLAADRTDELIAGGIVPCSSAATGGVSVECVSAGGMLAPQPVEWIGIVAETSQDAADFVGAFSEGGALHVFADGQKTSHTVWDNAELCEPDGDDSDCQDGDDNCNDGDDDTCVPTENDPAPPPGPDSHVFVGNPGEAPPPDMETSLKYLQPQDHWTDWTDGGDNNNTTPGLPPPESFFCEGSNDDDDDEPGCEDVPGAAGGCSAGKRRTVCTIRIAQPAPVEPLKAGSPCAAPPVVPGVPADVLASCANAPSGISCAVACTPTVGTRCTLPSTTSVAGHVGTGAGPDAEAIARGHAVDRCRAADDARCDPQDERMVCTELHAPVTPAMAGPGAVGASTVLTCDNGTWTGPSGSVPTCSPANVLGPDAAAADRAARNVLATRPHDVAAGVAAVDRLHALQHALDAAADPADDVAAALDIIAQAAVTPDGDAAAAATTRRLFAPPADTCAAAPDVPGATNPLSHYANRPAGSKAPVVCPEDGGRPRFAMTCTGGRWVKPTDAVDCGAADSGTRTAGVAPQHRTDPRGAPRDHVGIEADPYERQTVPELLLREDDATAPHRWRHHPHEPRAPPPVPPAALLPASATPPVDPAHVVSKAQIMVHMQADRMARLNPSPMNRPARIQCVQAASSAADGPLAALVGHRVCAVGVGIGHLGAQAAAQMARLFLADVFEPPGWTDVDVAWAGDDRAVGRHTRRGHVLSGSTVADTVSAEYTGASTAAAIVAAAPRWVAVATATLADVLDVLATVRRLSVQTQADDAHYVLGTATWAPTAAHATGIVSATAMTATAVPHPDGILGVGWDVGGPTDVDAGGAEAAVCSAAQAEDLAAFLGTEPLSGLRADMTFLPPRVSEAATATLPVVLATLADSPGMFGFRAGDLITHIDRAGTRVGHRRNPLQVNSAGGLAQFLMRQMPLPARGMPLALVTVRVVRGVGKMVTQQQPGVYGRGPGAATSAMRLPDARELMRLRDPNLTAAVDVVVAIQTRTQDGLPTIGVVLLGGGIL